MPSLIIPLVRWAAGHLVLAIGGPIATGFLLLVLFAMARLTIRSVRLANKPSIDNVATVVASLMCLSMSLDTSWEFTRKGLHIHNFYVRLLVVAFYEVTLIAFALLERAERIEAAKPVPEGQKRKEPSGVPGLMVKLLAGIGMVPAFTIGGVVGGLWRFAAVLIGLVLFHTMVGNQIRLRGGIAKDGTIAKVVREIRERLLSRLGLGDESRTAVEIRKDRAVVRAATLALTYKPDAKFGRRRHLNRLRKALRVSGVASDLGRRRRLLDELAVGKFAAKLSEQELSIPWEVVDEATGGNRRASKVASRRVVTDGVVDNPRDNRPGDTVDNPAETTGGNHDNRLSNTPRTTGNGNSKVVEMGNRPSRLDRTIPIVRELGPDVPLSVIMQRLGFDKSAASKMRKDAIAALAAETDDASAEETG